MNPGQLNSRVTLKHLAKTEDEAGGYAENYVEYAKVWAKLVNKTVSKELDAEEVMTISDYEITMRYRKDVLFTDRLYIGTREFEQIAPAVNILEKNSYLKLIAREVPQDA